MHADILVPNVASRCIVASIQEIRWRPVPVAEKDFLNGTVYEGESTTEIACSLEATRALANLNCSASLGSPAVKNTKKFFEIFNKNFFCDKQDHFIYEIEKQIFFSFLSEDIYIFDSSHI